MKANSYVIFPYHKRNGKIEIIKENELKEKYPLLYKYLKYHEETIKKRDVSPPIGKDDWYKFGRSQHLDSWDADEKKVVGVLSTGNKYPIDKHKTIVSSGGTAGYCVITIPENSEYSIYYIQALLNSKYLEWFSSIYGEVFRGGYIARGTKVLKQLPIRVIDFTNQEDKNLHDNIAETQKSIIRLQGDIDKNNHNKRKLTILKRQFDSLIKNQENNLKQLFNIGRMDDSVPLIAEMYGTT